MKQTTLLTILLLLIVTGGGAFFAGTKYQKSKQATAFQNLTSGSRNGGNRMGMRPVSGEIIASDDKSVTIKLADGSSKIIILSDKTTINKATAGSKDDLKTGTRVAAFGSENSDGSILASTVQLNSTFNVLGNQTSQKTKSPDAKEIVVEGSNFAFSPSTINVKKGEKVRIVLKNNEGFHDFHVDELGIAIGPIQAGQQDFVEFTPDKTGSFEFYCAIGNHRAMGMKGTLVVE